MQLAVEARDEALRAQEAAERPLLVAASVGCYGAARADGSEYRGDYGLSEDELVEWHRPRLRILAEVRQSKAVASYRSGLPSLPPSDSTYTPRSPPSRQFPTTTQQAGADLLAFETIPCLVELRAVARLVSEERAATRRSLPCWVTVACRDGATLNSGEPLEAAAALLDSVDPVGECVVAFGVNCTPPQHVEAAVTLLRKTLESGGGGQQQQQRRRRLLIVYPNSGETWDGKAKAWEAGSGVGSDPEAFAALAERWVGAGARVVGGCCRTTPATINALRRRLVVEKGERGGGGGP